MSYTYVSFVPSGYVVCDNRPESSYTWLEPAPLAGLHAALAVARLAERRAHQYAVKLRGEGTSWKTIADLLEVPYSDDYSRPERAYELVAGPAEHRRGAFADLSIYWTCGGPLGCGKYITDRGPYNGWPSDNENGHAADCQRIKAENEAYERESEERERRWAASKAALAKITDAFDLETVKRCQLVLRRGGQVEGPWSTSEMLAVALVLRDNDYLQRAGYSTRKAAILRVYNTTPDKVRQRIALLRTAATGETS